MPSPSSKHSNEERISFPGFEGGLNLTSPMEELAPNELSEALNMEYSAEDGGLKVRGGLRRVAEFGEHGRNIGQITLIHGQERFVALDDVSKHFFTFPIGINSSVRDNGAPVTAWAADYRMPLVGAAWDKTPDDAQSLPVVLLAPSAKLVQIESAGDGNATNLASSPNAVKNVFIWGGRVGINSNAGAIGLSAVGDYETWDNQPSDLSSGQSINVGYKDTMDIKAICTLSKDLIVFKGSRRFPGVGDIWRVSGYIPDTIVYKVASGVSTYTQNSVCVAGNDVFFLNRNGLGTLSSVMEYGDVKLSWLDAKVADVMAKDFNVDSCLWHIPHKSQLWVTDREKDHVWVFHYKYKSWTRFKFAEPVVFACSLSGLTGKPETYVVTKDAIYRVDDSLDKDENATEKIRATIRTGSIVRDRQVLVKGVGVLYSCGPKADGFLQIGDFRVPLSKTGRDVYVFDDATDAFMSTRPVLSSMGSEVSRRRCIVRGWEIVPEIIIEGTGCSIQKISLNIAGV